MLLRFPPRWPDAIADHVTLRSGTAADTPLPGPTQGEIIGRADDGAGVEALIVRVDGTTDRADGGTFHITWSLNKARGRHARESNDVIAALGWEALPTPALVTLIPAYFG